MAASISSFQNRNGGAVSAMLARSFGLRIIGSGFGDEPGVNGKVEIVQNSNDTGTKVSQHIMSWSDTLIEIATDPDPLFTELQTGTLTAYLFVTGNDASRSGGYEFPMQWRPVNTPNDLALRVRYYSILRHDIMLANVRFAVIGDRTASQRYDDIQAALSTALTRMNALPIEISPGVPLPRQARTSGVRRIINIVTRWGMLGHLTRDEFKAALRDGATGTPLSDFLTDQRATNTDYLDGTIDLETWLDDTQTNAVAAGISTFNADTAAILQASRLVPAI